MKAKVCNWVTTLTVGVGILVRVQAASTIQFAATGYYTVPESAGTAQLTVQRTGDLSTVVSVDYATVDGTATNGLKYTAVSGRLPFGTGETNQTISVPILNEGLVGGTRNFRVILSNATGGALLGTRTNVPVFITGNDVGIQFQLGTYSVNEDAGAVLLPVVRGDDGTNAVTVDYATADVDAPRWCGSARIFSAAPVSRQQGTDETRPPGLWTFFLVRSALTYSEMMIVAFTA